MPKQPAPAISPATAKPGDAIDLSQSVAGEEDPGASVDMDDTAADGAGAGERKGPTDAGDRPAAGHPPKR